MNDSTPQSVALQNAPNKTGQAKGDWLKIRGFVAIYFFLALISLAAKLKVTPDWFNGKLDENHSLLMSFGYTNNEQSRLFQFLIPEVLVRCLGLEVTEAYILQRWVFVWVAFVFFHVYLRKWFSSAAAFAGVCFLAAVMQLTYMNDLQESAPLLMVLFLAGLWALRGRKLILFTVTLFLGALDNETVLCLPALLFFLQFRGWRGKDLWSNVWKTLASATPAYVVTAAIRYATRNQPHLGGSWHLPDNVEGIISQVFVSPLDYYRAAYLYPVFIFGALWVYAALSWSQAPRFIRCTLYLIPLFIIPHLLTGIIREVRQLIPLAYIVIPAAMHRLFSEERLALGPLTKTDGPPLPAMEI